MFYSCVAAAACDKKMPSAITGRNQTINVRAQTVQKNVKNHKDYPNTMYDNRVVKNSYILKSPNRPKWNSNFGNAKTLISKSDNGSHQRVTGQRKPLTDQSGPSRLHQERPKITVKNSANIQDDIIKQLQKYCKEFPAADKAEPYRCTVGLKKTINYPTKEIRVDLEPRKIDRKCLNVKTDTEMKKLNEESSVACKVVDGQTLPTNSSKNIKDKLSDVRSDLVEVYDYLPGYQKYYEFETENEFDNRSLATATDNSSQINNNNISVHTERAILTSKNDTAGEINKILLDSFQAESIEYRSVNSVLEIDDAVNYPVEFLNSLNPPGFPSHLLTLKIGNPIMLLRNLNPPKLCNGTRLRITGLQKNLIEAQIMTGSAKDESVFIPRIPIIPSDYPFQFKRMQFPVKVYDYLPGYQKYYEFETENEFDNRSLATATDNSSQINNNNEYEFSSPYRTYDSETGFDEYPSDSIIDEACKSIESDRMYDTNVEQSYECPSSCASRQTIYHEQYEQNSLLDMEEVVDFNIVDDLCNEIDYRDTLDYPPSCLKTFENQTDFPEDTTNYREPEKPMVVDASTQLGEDNDLLVDYEAETIKRMKDTINEAYENALTRLNYQDAADQKFENDKALFNLYKKEKRKWQKVINSELKINKELARQTQMFNEGEKIEKARVSKLNAYCCPAFVSWMEKRLKFDKAKTKPLQSIIHEIRKSRNINFLP